MKTLNINKISINLKNAHHDRFFGIKININVLIPYVRHIKKDVCISVCKFQYSFGRSYM